MNFYGKLMAVITIAISITPAYGMQRLLRATRTRVATKAQPQLISARVLATASVQSRYKAVAGQKKAAPVAHPVKATYFTQAWKTIFPGKQNDPVQFEADVREMIKDDKVEDFASILKNNAELLKQNQNQFVRKAESVPYLIQASGQSREANPKLMSSLILHCPTEINEVYFNPRVQASGCRRLIYAHHEYPTPLTVAIQHHHYDTAELLLDKGADANTILGHPDYPTVLAHAIKRCEPRIVRKLLERGAYIKYAGYDALATARRNYQLFGTSYEADILNLIEEFNNKTK